MTHNPLDLTRGSKSNKPVELLKLKQEGHDLIDALVSTGLSRGKVYRRMAKRLKRPQGKEHFGKMNAIGEAREAVDLLATWLKDRLDAKEREINPPQPKVARRKANTLPYHEQVRLIREMKADQERAAALKQKSTLLTRARIKLYALLFYIFRHWRF